MTPLPQRKPNRNSLHFKLRLTLLEKACKDKGPVKSKFVPHICALQAVEQEISQFHRNVKLPQFGTLPQEQGQLSNMRCVNWIQLHLRNNVTRLPIIDNWYPTERKLCSVRLQRDDFRVAYSVYGGGSVSWQWSKCDENSLNTKVLFLSKICSASACICLETRRREVKASRRSGSLGQPCLQCEHERPIWYHWRLAE